MVSLPVFLCGIMEILNDGFLSSCAGQDAMAWVSLDRVTFSRRPKTVLNVAINVIQPSMGERIDVPREWDDKIDVPKQFRSFR